MDFDEILNNRLAERRALGLLRQLRLSEGRIDFSSNDYLGFARSSELRLAIENTGQHVEHLNGSTGSRLLAGNYSYTEEVERFIADYHQAEAALIFNSGYDANLGLLSSLPKKGDTVISDELVHASIIDGIRLSYANRYTFRHNDLEQLEAKLKVASGSIFIVTESIFSMDGDEAPLEAIVRLAERYGAHVIVDEAHATGLYGKKGEGKVIELGLQDRVFARVHTYGKALGVYGAAVVGSAILRNYLINHARSFIYTTALPFHSVLAIKKAYDILSNTIQSGLIINKLIILFKQKTQQNADWELLPSNSPIQSLIISGNERCRALAHSVQHDGFDVRPILSPTVAQGRERIRICLHNFNTKEEVEGLADSLLRHHTA